jgi:mono/diheme cytochrome c family protein
MKKSLVFLVVGMLCGPALWAQSIDRKEYNKGKNLFSDKCHVCHGKLGDGNGPAAGSLSSRPANFTNPKFWTNNVEKKIADTIRSGSEEMPPFNLTPDQIRAIIFYMEHTFKKEGKG